MARRPDRPALRVAGARARAYALHSRRGWRPARGDRPGRSPAPLRDQGRRGLPRSRSHASGGGVGLAPRTRVRGCGARRWRAAPPPEAACSAHRGGGRGVRGCHRDGVFGAALADDAGGGWRCAAVRTPHRRHGVARSGGGMRAGAGAVVGLRRGVPALGARRGEPVAVRIARHRVGHGRGAGAPAPGHGRARADARGPGGDGAGDRVALRDGLADGTGRQRLRGTAHLDGAVGGTCGIRGPRGAAGTGHAAHETLFGAAVVHRMGLGSSRRGARCGDRAQGRSVGGRGPGARRGDRVAVVAAPAEPAPGTSVRRGCADVFCRGGPWSAGVT